MHYCQPSVSGLETRNAKQKAWHRTEQEWLRLAAEKSSRELEELASSSLPGDTPPEEKDEDIEDLEYAWATIRFEKHHYEQLMRAAVRIRTRLGDPDLSLSQLLLTLAERELEREDQDEVVAAPRGENAFREQSADSRWQGQHFIRKTRNWYPSAPPHFRIGCRTQRDDLRAES